MPGFVRNLTFCVDSQANAAEALASRIAAGSTNVCGVVLDSFLLSGSQELKKGALLSDMPAIFLDLLPACSTLYHDHSLALSSAYSLARTYILVGFYIYCC